MKNLIYCFFISYILLVSLNTQANSIALKSNRQIVENNDNALINYNNVSTDNKNQVDIKRKNNKTTLKVFTLNIWLEGTPVKGGYEGIVNAITSADADLISLNEVKNYNHIDFTKQLVKTLNDRGLTYYSYKSKNDASILSRYPIIKHSSFDRFTKALIQINNTYIDFYSGHLDYKNAANYLPRGYDGNTWKELPNGPDTNIDDILKENNDSKRPNSINLFINNAKNEINNSRIIILAGDFNEPSWLDWSDKTKNLFDHHGTVVPWTSTRLLTNADYLDTYRVKYPNPVAYPGFTWPANNVNVEISKLVWAPKADERERIDFIFYHTDPRLTVQNAVIAGPSGSIVRGKRVEETSHDKFQQPKGTWPSDHKGVLITFDLKT
ncbi:endonuclease/exonuclease/phosphatase family protein [Xenorhabdus lircayensis]|uniref:Endonuclease/exonuclease/phosphatase family protein n=1 Tax=Xenorhabdus lircayensis TaxID=2763499 RepID=A0ABS0U3R6_9GAMM|nr:endonuclease/exonuclease/phosphatase family protein [Xenorhabdus lircayensis]MBI6548524.1 endonuclease/exonuclease/phosphatase family protein [Xenorhabdus lircayensis]